MKKFFRIGSGKKNKGLDASSQGKGSTKSLNQSPIAGYDLREKDLGKIQKAVWTGDLNKVKQLVKKDANQVDKEQRTPLHLACARGNEAVVSAILEYTNKVNKPDSQGRTPLMKAVECGHEACARLLLTSGGNPNAQDKYGDTSLHLAARRGDHNLISLLGAHDKIDPNIHNQQGYTPLHETVLHKHRKCFEELDATEPDIDIQDADGRTALMLACQTGQPDFARLLLDYDAKKSIKDKQGWTADEIASMAGNEACRQVLAQFEDDDDDDDDDDESASAQRPPPSQVVVAPPAAGASHQDAQIHNLDAPPGFGAPAEDVGDMDSASEMSKASEAAGGTQDSWKDSDSEEDSSPGNKGPAVNKLISPSEDESQTEDPAPRMVNGKGDKKGGTGSRMRNDSTAQSSSGDWSDEDESLFSSANNKPNLVQLQKQKQEEVKEKKAELLEQDEDDDWGDNSFPLSTHEDKPKISLLQGLANHANKSQNNDNKDTSPPPKQPNVAAKVTSDLGLSEVEDVSDIELSDNEIPPPKSTQPPPPVKTPAHDVSRQSSKWDSDEESDDEADAVEDMVKDIVQPQPISSTPRQKSAMSWDSTDDEKEEGSRADKSATDGVVFSIGDTKLEKQEDNSNWDSGSEIIPSPRKDDDSQGAHQEIESVQQFNKSDWDSDTEPFSAKNDEIDSVLQANKPAVIVEEEVPVQTKLDQSSAKTGGNEEEDDWDSDEDDEPAEGAVDTQAFLTEPPPPLPAQPPPQEPSKAEEKVAKPALVSQGSMMAASEEEESEEEEEEEEESTWEKERREEKERKKKAEEAKKAAAAKQALLQELSDEDDEPDGPEQEGTDGLDEERRKKWEDEWEQNQEKLRREAAEEMRREIDMERRQSMESLDNIVDEDIEAQVKDEKLAKKEVESKAPPPVRDQPPQIEDFSDDDEEENAHSLQLRMRKEQAEKQLEAAKQRQREQEEEEAKRQRDIQQQKLKEQQQEKVVVVEQKVVTPVVTGGMDVSFEDTDDDMEIMPSITGSPRKNDVILSTRQDDDDDGLSYSSTEHEASVVEDKVMPNSHVSNKQEASIISMHSESVNVMRLQEQFRDSQRKLDRERSQRTSLETKKTTLEQERTDLIQKLEDVTRAKSTLEQGKIELEAKIRNLQYSVSEEEEKRKNSEVLYKKCKEQLDRKEEQYTAEIEAKQKTELAMRNLQIELRTALSNAKQLEEEREDLARQLNHEREARLLQEKINDEQTRFNQSLHEDPASHSAEALAKLENMDEAERASFESQEKLRTELCAVKAELERQRGRQKEDHELLSGENEELHRKIQQLKDEMKLGEEALAHATLNYTMEVGVLKTENSKLHSNVGTEHAEYEKLKAECESLKTRLETSIKELEKEQKARSDLESTSQRDKDEWRRLLDRAEHEQAHLKEAQQTAESRLREAEGRTSRIENELAVANATLTERTSQLATIQKELDLRRNNQGGLDDTLLKEKEENTRLSVRCESLQERVTSMQHETITLRQQLDEARIASAKGEGAENLNQVLNSLRADQEKNQAALQEKNAALNESIIHLKEELRNVDNRRITLETELRAAQSDVTDSHRKLSMAEASLEVANRGKEQLESEQSRLRSEVEKLQSRLAESTEKQLEAQRRMSELVERVEKAETTVQTQSQQLVQTNDSLTAMAGGKDAKRLAEAEDKLHQMELEKARVEAALKHETQRVEMLQRELADSNQEKRKVRKAIELKKAAETKLEAEVQKNIQLQKEITTLRGYLKAAKKRLKAGSTTSGGSSDLDRARQDFAAQSQLELNMKLQEVNAYLEEQAGQRDKLDRMREDNESELRREFERTRRELLDELSRVRAEQQAVLTEKEIHERESKRLQSLYDNEVKLREKLMERLERANSNARVTLLTERQFSPGYPPPQAYMPMDSGYMVNNQWTVNKRSHGLNDLSEKIRQELDRSIAKHLEKGPHIDINPPPRATLDDSVMSMSAFNKSRSEYLNTLQRNYFV